MAGSSTSSKYDELVSKALFWQKKKRVKHFEMAQQSRPRDEMKSAEAVLYSG